MFGISDFLKLLLSAFIILPMVSIIREGGYLLTSYFLGAKNSKVVIGCGPRIFNIGIFEFRKYYFMYSWCSYDNLRYKENWAQILVYASPIVANIAVALIVNFALSFGWLDMKEFGKQFIYYAFYFVLFDLLPIYYPDGQPSNGRIVYELFRYGQFPEYEKE
ncbi:hypothetical protein [Alkalihalobacillus sp. CinArs1]|uniref:hypothetical protein n=1 Tax=Alkalihalobacillus sp. CinArs1 TaxID=2995314 RepID=UPI0022DE6C6B|nr:hypothetical protein [Alkalihalobacillus sp. CinArs1]